MSRRAVLCARLNSALHARRVTVRRRDLARVDATLGTLIRAGYDTEVVDRELVPLGPVLRSRLPWLRERGLMSADQDKEELVVFRARRL
ncbi:hypothetical protein ACIQPQ_26335 [Streptomyces sp. NPDC091281]|uniref:hypothetical protein n=1 Tax=Streptomyces sp. NPDC091281 TaxID=3365985 RepID=UPI0038005EB7